MKKLSIVGALTLTLAAIAFADGYMDDKIDSKVKVLQVLVKRIYHQLDRIEDQVDRLIEKGK